MRAFETVRVLQGKSEPEATFAATFLMQIPGDTLRRIGRDLETQHGPIRDVTDVRQTGPSTARFKIRFEKVSANATLAIEPHAPFRVISFYISDFVPLDDSPEATIKEF